MTIKYPFSKDGVKWFADDTINDIMNAIENGNTEDFDLFITIGNREIKIPLAPETYEALEKFLENTIKEMEEC